MSNVTQCTGRPPTGDEPAASGETVGAGARARLRRRTGCSVSGSPLPRASRGTAARLRERPLPELREVGRESAAPAA